MNSECILEAWCSWSCSILLSGHRLSSQPQHHSSTYPHMQRPCTHSASYKTFQTLFQNTSISIYHPLNSLSCPRPKKPLRHYSTRTPCTTPPQPHPSVGVHTIHTPHQYHQPIPKPNTKVPEAFPKGQPPPCSTPRPIHPSFPA
jgi:hypothetical protein